MSMNGGNSVGKLAEVRAYRRTDTIPPVIIEEPDSMTEEKCPLLMPVVRPHLLLSTLFRPYKRRRRISIMLNINSSITHENKCEP